MFYSKYLCVEVPITTEPPFKNNNFELYSGNDKQECDEPLGALSDYKVFLGNLTWESGKHWVGIGTFLIQVFKKNEQILGATGNFSSDTNKIYLTEYFGDSLGGAKPIPPPDPPQPGDVARLITITNKIIIDKFSYDCEFSYQCLINPNAEYKFSYNATNLKLKVNLQSNNNLDESTPNNSSLLKSINKKLRENNVILNINFKTDEFGLNLGEMFCRLDSNKIFPNGYPKKYIGRCVDYQIPTNSKIKTTLYSFKPNIQKVLKLSGNVLYQQTKNINDKYETGLNDCQFYYNILGYSTLRYIFAGLSNNSVFSLKWLCSNNYQKFLINLGNSEFSEAVPLFTEPQPEFDFDFSNYNRYYRKCKCQK